jgi:hypothetical protein
MSKIHNEFCRRIGETSKAMSSVKGIKSPRKGWGRVRDYLLFFKNAFGQAESWAGLPRAIVYWLALTPIAIANFNEFLKLFGSSFYIPLAYGSVVAVGFVVGLMIFGVLAWTHLGLRKGQSELGGKQDPVYTLFYGEFQELKKEMSELRKEIRGDK